jgi:uncharacterized protein YbbC (DUF1343 family)
LRIRVPNRYFILDDARRRGTTRMRAFAVAVVMGWAGALLFCGTPPTPPNQPSTPPPVDAAAAEASSMNLPDARARATLDNDPLQERFRAIDVVVTAAIEAGKMPGCVIVVGHHDEVLFERAYGSRALLPERTPMTTETVFDLASLTKPVATATSIMILVERGKVDLDARAASYVPELARLPPFTVRQLLVHTSGLPAGTPMSHWSTNRADVLRHIASLSLKSAPGEQFLYSDVGFVVLQEIVQRASGKSLAAFAAEEIFAPLGMKETGFLPPAEIRSRAAPTEQRDGGFMVGEVHDPRAFALGGVAGHAGVFSTARDLSRFAQAMLSRGTLDGHRILGDKVFERLTTRHETSKGGRTLGWDLDSSFASHRSTLLSSHAFGHGGYTGTALWIDPDKDLFLLFLSNRVHPDGKGAVNPVVAEIAGLAIGAMEVKLGIDVLRAESFERLRGARIGLVTNASARARDGATTIDVLRSAPGVTLAAIFTPEHGLGADREGSIGDSSYAGVPVRSLYGERFTPSPASLAGIDTLVFDLQDVGMRFYTYASTMKRAMKIAADRKLRFVVLDRPNPINGREVQGPVLADSPEQMEKGFVNFHALPLRHGMTLGELARMFAEDDKLDLKLEVVPVAGWRRQDSYERTGLGWTPPSPNLRGLRSVMLYPAIGLLESTNVTVGRGTETPFEVVAAPWMDGPAVAKRLAELAPAGVAFEPTEVTPKSSVHANKKCRGIKIRITDPARFEPIRTGIMIASVLHEVHPSEWDFEGIDKMLRHRPALAAIRAGQGIADIEATWASSLGAFKVRREAFLLYR